MLRIDHVRSPALWCALSHRFSVDGARVGVLPSRRHAVEIANVVRGADLARCADHAAVGADCDTMPPTTIRNARAILLLHQTVDVLSALRSGEEMNR